MTEFTELYQKLSNSELLKIISESEKYNPIAVETAKTEIASRQLTEQELNQAKAKITEKENAKKREIEKRKEFEKKIGKNASTLFDTINPIQNGIQTPEKIIRLTILIFGGLAIYRLYQQLGMFQIIFHEGISDWDLSMIEYFFPIIILPIAVILYWKRNKIGWILLSIFLTYSGFNAIVLFFMNLGRQPSGIPALENLFPTVSPAVYVMTLLFFGGFLFLNCKEAVRNILKISKQTMLATIGFTLIVNLVFIYSIFG
ncbi:hypothetical protein [Lacinutrix sp. Hel_I_90]|uniref:hypothetical protein n=1 Tax=Lacinutrix sp. Hel_I_90 TaxID=1249999 RepID=UPI0005CABC71|nr:hypothetical protein [Lacinutrix sp. Hel_I_90]